MGEGVKPVPKRWWWTKRVGAAVGALLLVSIVAWAFWSAHADRVLRQVLDPIRARGEPLEWAEFAPPPVPDEDNAAELYRKAAGCPLVGEVEDSGPSLVTGPDGGVTVKEDAKVARLERLKSMVCPMLSHEDFRREHRAEMEEALALSAEARGICRVARQLKRADWKMDFTGPAFNAALPPLGTNRELTWLLCLAAIAAHEAGDDGEAVECILDALALSRAVGAGQVLISYLVMNGIHMLAMETFEGLLPELHIGPGAKAAAPRQVAALAAALGDEAFIRRAFVRAMMAERSMQYDTFERIRSGRLTLSGGRSLADRAESIPLLSPMWKLDQARALRYMTGYVAAAARSSYPQALDSMPAEFPGVGAVKRIPRVLSSMLCPILSRSFVFHHRNIAMRRMLVTAVAIRRYQLDHGRRPETLAALAPKYLPAVPLDPFAADGAPLLYIRAGERPLLYSVFTNGKDDGGSFEIDDWRGVNRESDDFVLFLNGDRPVGECDWQDPAVASDPMWVWPMGPETPTSAPAGPLPPGRTPPE